MRTVPGEPDGSYAIAVRSLCEFTARRGDLDLRFTPAPTAQQGVAGHQLVASRHDLYQTEVTLSDFDIVSRQETGLVQRLRAEDLDTFFSDQCRRFLQWAQQEMAHRAGRDAALKGPRSRIRSSGRGSGIWRRVFTAPRSKAAA